MRHAVALLPLLAAVACGGTRMASVAPEPGERVRVTAPHVDIVRHDGTLARIDADTLVVGERAVAVEWVTRLQVSRGRRSHWIRGAGVGLGIGAIYGAVGIITRLRREGSGACDIWDDTKCVVFVAGIFGGPGMLIGAIIGAVVKTDRWEEVPLDQLRVSILPQRDGRVGLGLSLRF